MTVGVLIPVKGFSEAKVRLAGALDAAARAALARTMADTVLDAAGALPIAVVCDDDEVRAWAEARRATVVWAPGRGLNGAVSDGVEHLREAGIQRVIVAHADLPLATTLGWVADYDGITLVPDRHRDGTNVMCVPSGCGFGFAYGPRSFERHHAEAERLALPVRVVDDPRLGWDVDIPADLALPCS